MKHMITFLVAAGCLLFATSCNKDNDKTEYATNKAGERLVEKISYIRVNEGDIYSEDYLYSYNPDGTLESYKAYQYDELATPILLSRENDTVYVRIVQGNNTEDWSFECRWILNTAGLIVSELGEDRDFRLTYDESGKYLNSVFDGDELIWTFEWEDGNIANEEVSYISQPQHSNVDWGLFLQTWRINKTQENEQLLDIAAICFPGAFYDGLIGHKCQGLPSEDYDSNFTYEFDEDGFVSVIHEISKRDGQTATYTVTYKKK